ncbi:PREDICTED: protein DEHYDRATION-INDUCED 19 homolog 6-like isoform X1 [Tarenaya hassleriana]|uniref:protein DEHYDRATION-INDUCED 19 homolog 6-like isoform X1 n=1 Tax=Tarenaya hassleriana TaxID=28532 RepID=UPI00053C279D|nr:PREDICTED: protein DEHYDRATION-INDUCED 19 homolog 6-like isoform X1 [Tarenaya hassleriana]
MDSDSWRNHLASASRRYQLAFLSRSDTFLGFEEIDGEDDFREEFACPFCSDYFDIVSLCCHIDEEHPTEARNGVCPVCMVRVGIDMIAHITLQHANIFKMQRKRKSRRGGSQSTLSEILKSEFPERNLESLFGDSSCVVSSSTANAAADPLLSSFISPMPDGFFTSECRLLAPETDLSRKTSNETSLERNVGKQSLSAEDHKEKLKRSEFVQGLLSSVILDDGL